MKESITKRNKSKIKKETGKRREGNKSIREEK